MYWSILKKDLKRKKTMNVILLIFVILATMFVASSVSNIMATMGGAGYFFEQAGVSDYAIIHSGDEKAGAELNAALEKSGEKGYKLENMLFLTPKQFYIDNKQCEEMNSYFFIMSIDESAINIFDKNNEKITFVEEGKVYIPKYLMDTLSLSVGDKFQVDFGDYRKEFEIAGYSKDAIFGAKMFTNPRLLINPADYAEIQENTDTSTLDCRMVYVEASDVSTVKKAIAEVSGILFSDSTEVLKNMYLMDVLIAAILLIVSVCLILVAVVVLKFTISFTLTEEFREIGVMKAIGIRNSRIRGLYIVKYIAIAVIGSVIGFVLSIPFGKMLLGSVSSQMVLGDDSGILVNILSAAAVVVTVFGFCWFCTSSVKRSTPLDAIRNGQTGERFTRRKGIRIGKVPFRSTGYMAVNDVVSSPKRYMTLIIAFVLCLTIVLTLVTTAATLSGESLLPTFGVSSCDVFIPADVLKMDEIRIPEGETIVRERLGDIEKRLSDEDIPAECFIEIQYNVVVEVNGESETYRGQKNVGNIKCSAYDYTEGTAPENEFEIAVSDMVSREMGINIGDTVRIKKSDGSDDEYIVTGKFQTMNNMGKMLRLHQDFHEDLSQMSSWFNVQIKYTDEPSRKEWDQRFERIGEIYGKDDVLTVSGFVADCIGVGGMIDSLKFLILVLTMIVTALVTVLMERSFIVKETSEIALMKAIGFRSTAVMKIHTLRFGIVAVVASVIAAVLSIPITKLTMSPIFGMMGASHVTFQIDPLQIFLLYPAVVIVITMAAALLTSLCTCSIKARDISNIE